MKITLPPWIDRAMNTDHIHWEPESVTLVLLDNNVPLVERGSKYLMMREADQAGKNNPFMEAFIGFSDGKWWTGVWSYSSNRFQWNIVAESAIPAIVRMATVIA